MFNHNIEIKYCFNNKNIPNDINSSVFTNITIDSGEHVGDYFEYQQRELVKNIPKIEGGPERVFNLTNLVPYYSR